MTSSVAVSIWGFDPSNAAHGMHEQSNHNFNDLWIEKFQNTAVCNFIEAGIWENSELAKLYT